MKPILLLTTIITAGCSHPQPVSNQLAIARLEYKDKTEIVYLANDYGFLVRWPDNQAPELFVYNKPANRIHVTGDFETFLKNLNAFPSDVQVDRIRGCSITAAGMPEDQQKRLKQVIKDKQFHLTDMNEGNFTVCTCETKEVTWLRTFDSRLE